MDLFRSREIIETLYIKSENEEEKVEPINQGYLKKYIMEQQFAQVN